jgi:hypothetical protein
MITYTVVQEANETGFHVAITGSEGNRQKILGFATEAAADIWIARDRRQTDALHSMHALTGSSPENKPPARNSENPTD